MRLILDTHNAVSHASTMPEDAQIIGTLVRAARGKTGALVLLDDWSFVQITGDRQFELDQRKVFTAIVKALLAEFCDEHADLALTAGCSVDTIRSWSCGRRTPAFGTIKLLLTVYGVISNA